MSEAVRRRPNPNVALLLAAVPGILGIWGIGHLYAGERGLGACLLALGALVYSSLWLTLLEGAFALGPGTITALFVILVGWTWQVKDARKKARRGR